jgi:glycosyltransferase involved in cell wall biosynthesis
VRIATRKAEVPVIYTAHGFQFLKGGPIKDWLFFYPMEKYLSKYTDLLITLNQQDFYLAKKYFHAKQTVYVPGVGVDTSKFAKNEKTRIQKRVELGLKDSGVMLLSVGELNHNKNHQVVIRAIGQIKNNNNIHYFIAGQGGLKKKLVKLADSLGLTDKVHFLGYRSDIVELLSAADIFVLPSLREGLAVAGMEAMAAGLPLVGSDTRGIADNIENGQNGLVFAPKDVVGFAQGIQALAENPKICKQMGQVSQKKVLSYDLNEINKMMIEVYRRVISMTMSSVSF